MWTIHHYHSTDCKTQFYKMHYFHPKDDDDDDDKCKKKKKTPEK